MRPLRTPLRWPSTSSRWDPVHSPNDGALLGEVQQMEASDVERLLALVKEGESELKERPAHARAGWLRALAAKVRAEREHLAHTIATEGGKPLKDALTEADRAAGTFELCAEEALRLGGETLPMGRSPAGAGRLAFTLREPVGPVLALSAFNHPLNLLAHQVGPALAAGCPVAFKPAPATPYCGEWLADALVAVGAPSGVATLFHADIPEIQTLVADPRFAYISFIGSDKVGWELRRRSAPGTRLALEHGGQAPAVVWEDADLDAAATALVKGAFYHAGQVCISTQRILVHEKVFNAFVEKFTAKARAMKVGDARSPDTDVGPLIRAKEKTRLQAWMAEAVEGGAKTALDGSKALGDHFLAPTILTGVPMTCRLWREEAFGPVVAVNSFSTDDEVYGLLGEATHPFEASVFTASLSRALEAIKRLDAMTVVVNDHTAYRVDWMPFGGHGRAGLGMGGVRWAVEDMTRLKQAVLNGF